MKYPYAELGQVLWIKHQSYCFSLSEIALYFYLLDSCNNGRWENPFALRTNKIISDLGLKDDSITNAKRRLKSVGLIDFDTIQGSKFSHYQFPKLPIKSETLPKGLVKIDPKFRQSSGKVPADLPKKSATFETTPIIVKKDKDKDKETPTPLPFDCLGFSQAWKEWMDYRIEIKKPYRSKMSIPKALDDLVKKSKNDCDTAIAIINQSIANDWQGFFELKEQKKAPQTGAAEKAQYTRESMVETTNNNLHRLANGLSLDDYKG